MGYSTIYSLSCLTPTGEPLPPSDDRSIIASFRSSCGDAKRALDDRGYPDDYDLSWYSHCEDLCGFSLTHPTVLFLLTGDGESSPDYWRLYVLNGKSQLCVGEIVYPPFDPSLLT